MTCGFGSRLACMLVLSAFGTGGGCQLTSSADDRPGESRSVPALPSGADYQAEAPDVLHVAVSPLVPRPTYRIESGDTLYVRVPNAGDRAPINGLYPVGPDGSISLGSAYGSAVPVAGATVADAERAISERLAKHVVGPDVSVYVAHSARLKAVPGDHLVRPDGTIQLGHIGPVAVAGLSLAGVRDAVEAQLKPHLDQPAVKVSVVAANSRFFEVLADGAGPVRYSQTGAETVRDVLSLAGESVVRSGRSVWVQRRGGTVLPLVTDGPVRRDCVRLSTPIRSGDRVLLLSGGQQHTALMMGHAREAIGRSFGLTLHGLLDIPMPGGG